MLPLGSGSPSGPQLPPSSESRLCLLAQPECGLALLALLALLAEQRLILGAINFQSVLIGTLRDKEGDAPKLRGEGQGTVLVPTC